MRTEPALRDPRNHVIDHVYSVPATLEALQQARAGDDAAGLEIVWVERRTGVADKDWAFDHADSLRRFFAHGLKWA